MVAEAERDAAAMLIGSRAEANKKVLTMEAENQVLIAKAKAEAENMLILAEAQAQSRLKVAEVELQIMERQNNMPHAELRIFTEAQKEIFSNVQKVVYTDQQSLMLRQFYNLPDPKA